MPLPIRAQHLAAGTCPLPHQLWPAFSSRPGAAFLDTALPGPRARHSILACEPSAVLRSVRDVVTLGTASGPAREIRSGDAIDVLKTLLAERACDPVPGLPFIGGAIGWLGYEAGARRDGVHTTRDHSGRELPDLAFGLYDEVLVHDHATGETCLVAKTDDGLRRLRTLLESPIPSASEFQSAPPRPALDASTYAEAISRIRSYIAAGDVYQVNYTHRFETPFSGSAAALHLRLRELNPAPHAACLDFGDHQIVSSTPERLLAVRGRRIETRPIKGTLPRLPNTADDAAQRDRLLASGKDLAELLMIVDLARNDLGRVAAPGSVRVESRHDVETYATVHHLVATIAAELAPGLDRFDALRALHPGGSITGAPKIRAMQIIAELESGPRRAYTGALGYLGDDGDADLAIAIRTITCAHGVASYHVGGGITWDSVAATEYQETLHKGRALHDVLSSS